jgi:hypothetical protein
MPTLIFFDVIILGSFGCGQLQLHSLECSPAGTEAEVSAFLKRLAVNSRAFEINRHMEFHDLRACKYRGACYQDPSCHRFSQSWVTKRWSKKASEPYLKTCCKPRSASALVDPRIDCHDRSNSAFDRCSIGEVHKAYTTPPNQTTNDGNGMCSFRSHTWSGEW